MNEDELGKEICQIFEKMQLILAQKEKVLLKEGNKAVVAKITTMEIYVEQLEKIQKETNYICSQSNVYNNLY